MGLDMYLNAKRFFWFDEEAPKVNDLPDGFRVRHVAVDAAYWRKANAIHQWFVDNVQEGNDNCAPHHVSREQLVELVDICKQVLADPTKAGELLPTADGFFFGPTEYDNWYKESLQATIDQIERVLEKLPEDQWTFEYQSSW